MTADVHVPAQGEMPQPKAWRTAQARCLLAGFQAALSDDDAGRPTLIVSRWAMTRRFADLGELDRWLHRLSGGTA